MSSTPIQQAKLRLPLPLLMQQLGLGDRAKTSAKCPFHEDENPSFSVWQKEDVWFWKCHASCGHGDEITFLEKYRGTTRDEALMLFLQMAGCAPVIHPPARRPDNSEGTSNTSFDWQACVDALTESDLEQLGAGRWLSRAFFEWLHRNRLIGAHNGHIAFPNGNGTVEGAHVWRDGKDWFYHPVGARTHALVIGDLERAKQVHIFESQWDMLAFADKTSNYQAQGVALVATRGASNTALVKGKLPENASVLAWPQNDSAGEKWLSDLSTFVPTLGVARVPATMSKLNEFGEKIEVPLKDLNDWTKAGATAEDIYAAFFRNELYKPESAAFVPGEAVSLATLLEEVYNHLQRYVVFPGEAQPTAIALWVAHTWAIDALITRLICKSLRRRSSVVRPVYWIASSR